MTKSRAMLTLVDKVASDALRIGLAADHGGMRAQAARIRALADELVHRHPAEGRVVPLHAQLGKEIVRLAELIAGAKSFEAAQVAREPLDVLVVDDEPSSLRAVAAVVNDLGYAVRAANSAEAAMREFRARFAALVVSDWNMPGQSGLDLCRMLKEHDPRTYVILLTAFPEEALRMEGLRQGVDDFLAKPVDLDELSRRLEAAEGLVRAVRFLGEVGQGVRAGGLQPDHLFVGRGP
jgi:CheY-like chemotaxis protein